MQHPVSSPIIRLILLSGGLGGALATVAVGRPSLTALGLGIVLCVFCLAVVYRLGLSQGGQHLFSPTVLLAGYMLLGFGIRGVASVGGWGNKLEGAIDPTSADFFRLYSRMFAYCIVGVLGLLLGDALGRRANHSPSKDQAAGQGASNVPGHAVWLGVLLGGVGGLVLIAKLGTRLLTDPSYVSTAGTAGLFWVYPLLSAPLYGFTFQICASYARREQAPRWAIAGVLVSGLAVYLLTSSKSAVLNAAILLLVTRHLMVRPIRLRTLVLSALAFTLVLPIFYLHRAYGLTPDLLIRLGPGQIMAGFTILLGRSYLADSFAAIIQYTPRPYEYLLGRNWLEVLYFWVPRAIWPGKPVSYSLTFAETYLSSLDESHGSFFSPTLLGDAYLNFGPIGVPVMMFLIGFGLRLWYDRMTQGRDPARTLLYAASVYWIAAGAEQTVQVVLELAVSYMAIAGVIGLVGSGAVRRGRFLPGASANRTVDAVDG